MNIDYLRQLLSGERQEPVIVGYIYDLALVQMVAAAISQAVLISRDTIAKQAVRHPDIAFDEYCIMPDILRFGMVAQEYAEHLTFCYEHHTGRRFRLLIESATSGELFITSFHRTVPRQTKAILAGALVLRKHA